MVDDEALRRANLVKVTMEALVSATLILVYAKLLVSDDVKLRWKEQLKRWRTAFFGPPPLTEEQIREAARQVEVEANRVLRYGQ